MAAIFILFLLLSSLSKGASDIYDDYKEDEMAYNDYTMNSMHRMHGGWAASASSCPFIVSIRTTRSTAYFGDNHICGGVIIRSEWILTAAHCVVDINNIVTRPYRLTVVAGTLNRLIMTPSTVIRQVTKVIPHRKFRFRGPHDIALLKLNINLPADNVKIKTIQLIDERVAVNSICGTAGWGQLFYNGPLAARAITSGLMVAENEVCEKFYHVHFVGSTMLCLTNYSAKPAGLCAGDSGAPLAFGGKLAGIASFSKRCSLDINYPSVFVDVFYYKDWIQNTMNAGSHIFNMQNYASILIVLFICIL